MVGNRQKTVKGVVDRTHDPRKKMSLTSVCLTAEPCLTLRTLADKLSILKAAYLPLFIKIIIFAWFLPHFLTAEQKQYRVDCSRDFIGCANNKPDFLNSIILGHESWCYTNDMSIGVGVVPSANSATAKSEAAKVACKDIAYRFLRSYIMNTFRFVEQSMLCFI